MTVFFYKTGNSPASTVRTVLEADLAQSVVRAGVSTVIMDGRPCQHAIMFFNEERNLSWTAELFRVRSVMRTDETELNAADAIKLNNVSDFLTQFFTWVSPFRHHEDFHRLRVRLLCALQLSACGNPRQGYCGRRHFLCLPTYKEENHVYPNCRPLKATVYEQRAASSAAGLGRRPDSAEVSWCVLLRQCGAFCY